MSWLLHTRRVSILNTSAESVDGAVQPVSQLPQDADGSAAQPARRYRCAGVGDPDEVAWICFDCATCLCVEEALVKMPEYALSNKLWLGRERRLLQNRNLGLRMLLGTGRPCFRKLLLGKGQKEDLQSGFTGNHVLLSQATPNFAAGLPPTAEELSENFVVIYGRSPEELRKCHILTVQRDDYRALIEERCRVNSTFANTPVNQTAVNALPEDGVPAQIMQCAVRMEEVENYQPTRQGPGSIRDPVDAADPQDDASDELSDDEAKDEGSRDSAEQPATAHSEEQLNHCETPLGLDPTATPDFVQHLAAFKTQVTLVHEAIRRPRTSEAGASGRSSAEQPADADMATATAQAAQQEECYRVVVDLRVAAQKLDRHKFEDKVKLLESTDKALFVPTKDTALSMFDPPTWP